jgi:hypothetical protein
MTFRFLYRAVRRGLELVVLRFRAVDAKDVETLVLRHQPRYCDARSTSRASMTPTGPSSQP